MKTPTLFLDIETLPAGEASRDALGYLYERKQEKSRKKAGTSCARLRVPPRQHAAPVPMTEPASKRHNGGGDVAGYPIRGSGKPSGSTSKRSALPQAWRPTLAEAPEGGLVRMPRPRAMPAFAEAPILRSRQRKEP